MPDTNTMHNPECELRHPVNVAPGMMPRQRPIVLLSLPNTGTDWFVDLLIRNNSGLRYYREFFNPICNPLYEDDLNRAFGCEMVDNYAQIARMDGPHEEVFSCTWARHDYNFTKENYSAFKLNWFLRHFDCFVLYRSAERSLPGSRLQVKTWYDAMYWSLLENRGRLEPDVRALVNYATSAADTIAKRQVAAFVIYYYKLLKDARLRHVPILDVDRLMEGPREEQVAAFRTVPAVANAEKLAYDVAQEYRRSRKRFADLQADDFFAQLTARALHHGGEAVALLTPLREREQASYLSECAKLSPMPAA